jgi:uncharacterized protein YndB with AHSA1/START domain
MMRLRPYQWMPLCFLALTACAPSDETLSALGRNQQIQENAPVKASAEVVIHAPIDRVWTLFTDVQHWPRWQHDISKTSLNGPLASDAVFAWQAGDTPISSHVVLFTPEKAVAWTGKASIAKALHVWTFTAVDANTTRVSCRESMSGPLLSWFYSSADLQTTLDNWMHNLKAAAEAK